ncbi:MAG: M81 family metallopeptidase [Bryobacterales bacterium]|nr:M81 family metallopeptidase [Bryobacterales bacterium]
MRAAVASILQESNHFSPVKTRYEDFSPVFGEAAAARHRGKRTEMGAFLDVLSAAGVEIVPVVAAWAITANRMLRADFARLADETLGRLRAAGPVDMLLFALHGAQSAEGAEDAEGALLSRARELLGPSVPIVVTLDLHANVTRAMVTHATAIVGYKTYPHVDMYETGTAAAHLALAAARGQSHPAMAFVKLPLIVPAENMQTTAGPMAELVAAGAGIEERREALSVSIFGVQPWLDTPEMGCSVVVVTEGAPKRAARHASALARRFWKNRRRFDVTLTPPAEAIAQALALDGGPVVFAESADSTGSGSPGDGTGVLRALVDAGIPANDTAPSALFLVDPDAVSAAHAAGPGAALTLKLGGGIDRKRNRPVPLAVRVRMLSDGRWTPVARGYNPGIEQSMGRAAVLEAGSLRILAAERPTMTVDPELFRSHGIEPTRLKIVVVKSPNGFRAAYEPLARAVFVIDTPGASTANLRTLPFKKVPRPIEPLDTISELPSFEAFVR